MKKIPKVVGRIWMRGRQIVMGKVIKDFYFNSIYDYIDKAIINVLPPDEEIYSIDLMEPTERQLKKDPAEGAAFKEMLRYETQMSKALHLSAEMKQGFEAFVKNRQTPERYDRFITRVKQVTDNCVDVQIDIDELNEQTIASLNKFCRNAKKRGQDIRLVAYRGMLERVKGGRLAYCFNQQELEKIAKVNAICQKYFARELVFQGGPSLIDIKRWKYSEVVKANNKVYSVAKDIYDLHLSPAETQMVVHKYSSSFFFEYEKGYAEEGRTILSVLSDQSNPAIVCAGFASIEKAVTDKLREMGYKGLKNELYACRTICKNEKEPEFHCFNIVSIKDKKYDINGKYVDDSTRDAPSTKMPFQQALNFYLIPISDWGKLKYYSIAESYVKYMREISNYVIFDGFLKTKDKVKMAMINNSQDIDKILGESKVFALTKQGQPIPYETLKKITYNTFAKLLPEVPEERRTIIIEYELAMTVLFAKDNFKKNAQNGFAKHAYSLSEEEMKNVQNFVFPNAKNFKKLQAMMTGENDDKIKE